MKVRHLLFCVFLLSGTFLAAQHSQYRDDARFEVAPLVGYETHGSYPIDFTSSSSATLPPNADELRANGALSYGAAFDYGFNDNLQFEFLYLRNPTTYSFHDFTSGQWTPFYDTTVNTFQWGILAQFRADQKLRPFVAAGLGFAHEMNSGANPSRTVFAYNIGGGVKYFVNSHFGFRGEWRYLPTYGSSGVGQQCDYFGQCYQARVRNYEKRTNVAGGIIFRF